MRHQIRSLQIWLGLPALFLTLNPADTKHPFTARFSNAMASAWLPVNTDAALLQAMSQVNLAYLTASDPVAVSLAFHRHVKLFLVHLLGCNFNAVPADGVASSNAGGVFGPVAGYYGVTEPQLRGSLRVHLLVHLYAFSSPEAMLAQLQDNLPLLAEQLLRWASSLMAASLEGVATNITTDEGAQAILSSLQPLPWSARHRQTLQKSLGLAWDFDAAETQWHAAAPGEAWPASAPWSDPFPDAAFEGSSFLPWPRRYLLQTPGTAPDAAALLFDLRHSALHCCLHECRPRTCHKGHLGRLGFCRLGYWHWRDVSAWTQPSTWQRCHGLPLLPSPTIGSTPPHRGLLLPERHHPFHTRFNYAVLGTAKCNHDVSILVRAPSDAATLDKRDFLAAMSSSARSAAYYVTAYISKTQPHLVSLWQLLEEGQARLQAELGTSSADGPGEHNPRYLAARVLTRMLTACQRRVHKSMPEMCHYLLGYPEAYTSHHFKCLFLTNILRRAQCTLPLQRQPAIEPQCDTWIRTQSLQSADSHDSADASAITVTPMTQEMDYLHRGPSLSSWPLYFYVAAISRTTARRHGDGAVLAPFAPGHPHSNQAMQRVSVRDPWHVPQLLGPALPTTDSDPELRALMLLVLFKPWCTNDLADLLQTLHSPLPHLCRTWMEALADFLLYLRSQCSDPLHRPEPFTPAYWAQRGWSSEVAFSLFLR